MRNKSRQCSLVGAGILLICVSAIGGGKSSSDVFPVTTASVGSAAVNEWYGPFASWDNVKTKYGAVGDGVADDTVAISNALANVGIGANSPVLYFPSGTYRVTQKLWLNERSLVEIVGQDSATTILKYDGATDSSFSGSSTLFHAQAIERCHLARLTFDGNGKSKTVVSESEPDGCSRFDSFNSWEDCVFKNSASGGHGFDAGYFGYGFAGIDLVRCVFTNAAVGIFLGNWNALDGWLTDCYMVGCGTAVDVYRGSAHAYHTAFVNNQTDFLLEPAQATPFISLVSNVSYRSGIFFRANDVGQNQTPILLKGNTVIDPTKAVPIVIGQPGPVAMLDNVIANTNGAAVSFSNSMQADLLAVGNTNVVSSWYTVGSGSGLRTLLLDNDVVNRGSLTFSVPPLPRPATNAGRNVIEMPSNFTAASLQTAINNAADGSVIHIPWVSNADGSWFINQTITIPTNKDVRIVGDGGKTQLYWLGASGGTMFSLPHPSRATFSHVQFHGANGTADSLVAVTGVGSSAARVYLRDVHMQQGLAANVRLGDCPNTVIDYYGFGSLYNDVDPAHAPSTVQEGRGKVKYINTECWPTLTHQAPTADVTDFICTNGGSLYVETYYEECTPSYNVKTLRASGPSRVTFLCGTPRSNLDPNTWNQSFVRATTNGFAVTNFTGSLTFGLETGIMDYFRISGTGAGSVWLFGNTSSRYSGSAWPVVNSTTNIPVQSMNWNWTGNGLSRYADVGSPSAAYTRQMLYDARTEYSDRSPMVRRANQTDVLLEHVFFRLGQQNLWVKP